MSAFDRLARVFRSQAVRKPRHLCCSFCGRTATEVDRLVAGASAHICDECIAECVAVLEAHGGMPATSRIQ